MEKTSDCIERITKVYNEAKKISQQNLNDKGLIENVKWLKDLINTLNDMNQSDNSYICDLDENGWQGYNIEWVKIIESYIERYK